MRVTKSDVIHANPRHLPCILKVTTGVTMQQLGSELLILMETQGEMEKWVAMLEELSKVVRSKQQSVSKNALYYARNKFRGMNRHFH